MVLLKVVQELVVVPQIQYIAACDATTKVSEFRVFRNCGSSAKCSTTMEWSMTLSRKRKLFRNAMEYFGEHKDEVRRSIQQTATAEEKNQARIHHDARTPWDSNTTYSKNREPTMAVQANTIPHQREAREGGAGETNRAREMKQNKPEQHEARSGRLEGVHTDNAETAKCHQQLLKKTPALQLPRKQTRKPRAAK